MNEDIIIKLPKLGESILSATVVQWFKSVGERIERDEPLLEVSTDKVNSEIPSPVAGVLKKVLAEADQELDVGSALCVVSLTEEVKTKTAVIDVEIAETKSSSGSQEMRGFYSPSVLRTAQEKNVSMEELSHITPTGEGGRVTKRDIELYVESKEGSRKVPCPLSSKSTEERVKMNPLRKAIAENMVRSFYEAPHASLITEVDVTELLKCIAEKKESFLAQWGVKLTITCFIARAIARTLKEYPLINSSLEQDTIVLKKQVNLGIAVSIEQGVMVPVIKQCELLTLPEIAKAISDLSERTRLGKLEIEEVKEGTITLTNFGMTGVQIGIPIIRFPEVAIVGVGAVQRRVVPQDDDSFAIRSLMHISLTFDHRVLDGLYGCAFLNSLKKHIEQDLAL